MIYPTSDSYGHVISQERADALIAALKLLNEDEAILAMEEDANHHRENDFRQEMIDCIHVADVDEWGPSKYEGEDDYEFGICSECGVQVYREIHV